MKAAIFTINTRMYKEKKNGSESAVLKRLLEQVGLEVKSGVLPEDRAVVSAVMRQLSENGSVQLILTVGANGFLKRDCAPEALEDAAERLLPGIPETMRAYNMRYSKKVMLDRSKAGICSGTVMLNLPASPKLAKEGLEYVLPQIIQVMETLNL